MSQMMLVDGIAVHLIGARDALALIAAASRRETGAPLAVASVNLDHIRHFGDSRGSGPTDRSAHPGRLEWLNLIDGAPVAAQARRLSGHSAEKLSGSDLIGPILDGAEATGRAVAFVGGAPETAGPLAERLRRRWPRLALAGHWTPDRSVLSDPVGSRRLATEIAASEADILVVCLGKPRQEQWIEDYGGTTGAGVLLAFGAVVDFLAGRVARAPIWVSRLGGEWAWRLAREPGRLAHRYLIDGPPAYAAVRRRSAIADDTLPARAS